MSEAAGSVDGLVGKLVTEVEVSCNADKYYGMFKHEHADVPKAIPHILTNSQVLKGDGLCSGCIKQWNYVLDGKPLHVKEKTVYDDETRTIYHTVVGGDVLDIYKKYGAILRVNPKANGNGSVVSWTVEYEKINQDSPTPFDYLKLFDNIIKDLSSHLCSSG